MKFIDILPYLMSILTAVISGFATYKNATKKAQQGIKALEIQNKHDLEKLMNQHKLDIDAIKEKHSLDMEAREKEHMHKLELMQKEHENEIIRKEKELENGAKFGAMKDVMGELFGGVLGSAMNTPEVQEMISSGLKSSLEKSKSADTTTDKDK